MFVFVISWQSVGNFLGFVMISTHGGINIVYSRLLLTVQLRFCRFSFFFFSSHVFSEINRPHEILFSFPQPPVALIPNGLVHLVVCNTQFDLLVIGHLKMPLIHPITQRPIFAMNLMKSMYVTWGNIMYLHMFRSPSCTCWKFP